MTESPLPCPDAAALERLWQGHLPEDESAFLEQHVSQCPHCSAVIASLMADDPFVHELSRGLSDSFKIHSPIAQRLVERLRGLPVYGPRSTESEPQAKGVPAGAERVAATEASGPKARYPFLDPPQSAGEIGRLGKYRILSVLGSGGMGVVFRAHDMPLNRLVALKVLQPRYAESSPGAQQRFLREARAAASLHHDHVVIIYEVGQHADTPFIAMELLHGESLQDRLQREGCLPPRASVPIAQQIALALSAAHDRGLVHRDIKPSNIWLEPRRANAPDEPGVNPRVKLLDFGLVRVDSPEDLTRSGVMLGTLGYMAPEAVQGKTVDARSDLFSFGCVLYRMLAGKPAFHGDDPLTILFHMAACDPEPLYRVNPRVPRALSDLVQRLLNNDPSRRFTTAREVADELRKMDVWWHRPAPDAPPRTQSKWLRPRRWRAMLLIAAALVLPPFAPTLIRVVTNQGQLVIEAPDRDVEVTVLHEGDEKHVVLLDRQTRRRFTLTAGRYEIRVRDQQDLELTSSGSVTLRRGGRILFTASLVRAPSQDAVADAESPTDRHPDRRGARPAPIQTVIGDSRLRHWNWVTSIALSQDGQRLISGSWDSTAKVWNTETGDELLTLAGHELEVLSVAIHPSGTLYATGGADCLWKLWDARSGETKLAIPADAAVHTVAFSPDGQRLAAMTRLTLGMWNPQTGELVWQIRWPDDAQEFAQGFTFHPDGRSLAVRSADEVRIIDSETHAEITSIRLEGERVSTVRYSPGGKYLAIGTCRPRAEVRLFDADQNEAFRFVHDNALADVLAVAFHPQEQAVVAAFGSSPYAESEPSAMRTRQWRLIDNTEGPSIVADVYNTGHLAVAYTRDGTKILAAGHDGTIRYYDVATGEEASLPSPRSFVCAAAVSPDGTILACGRYDHTITLVDSASGKERQVLQGHQGAIFDLTFLSDGREIVSSSTDGTVRVWDVETGKNLSTTRHWAAGVAGGCDGQVVAAGGRWYEHTLRLWDSESFRPWSFSLGDQAGSVACFALSDTGMLLATGQVQGPAVLWDLSTGGLQHRLVAPPGSKFAAANAMAFSPDGQTLAVAYGRAPWDEGETRLWETQSGRLTATLPAYRHLVMSLAFSPDGQVLATGGWRDGSVRLWQAATGRPLRHFALGPPASGISKLIFFGDGRRLAALGSNGRVYVLRLDGLEE